MRHIGISVVVGIALFASPTAQAVFPVDLSTGLDGSDTLITVGNSPDGHWTVDQPGGGTAPARVVTASDADGIYVGSIWAANGPGSAWIAIDASTINNAPVTPYTYYRTFNLTAAEASQASISGTWGIDDGGDVRLNGNLLSTVPNDYTATTPFSAAAGSGMFLVGANTLTITMTFSDNVYEAVRLTGALNIPEPASLGLITLGAAALLRRPRQRI